MLVVMRLRATALLLLAALMAAATVAASAASAADPVRLLTGPTPETGAFPADRFTVADPAQLTGRRVALPVPTCTAGTRTVCDSLSLLNTLDGFDLQPRVFLPFSGRIDVATVTPDTVSLPALDGFTESIPEPHGPPILDPAPGAMELQRYLAYATWYGRPGGPETYAPLIRRQPRNGGKSVRCSRSRSATTPSRT